VADDQNAFRFLVASYNLSQSIPCPLGDIAEPLAARNGYLRKNTAPAR
jgi:hypothetical protein